MRAAGRFIIVAVITACVLFPGCASRTTSNQASWSTQQVAGVELRVPHGFKVSLFAEDLGRPRFMAFDPRGRLTVCDANGGRVLLLPERNGRADQTIVFADDIPHAHSIQWHNNRAYVAAGSRIYEFTASGNRGTKRRVVTDRLPTPVGHTTRTLVFGPDGKIYVSAGSSSNVNVESDNRRATIMRLNTDGSGFGIYATGLRNAVGLAFNPVTKQLWATDNGRDNLGDNIPPDELNIIQHNGFYGWPYYYGNNVPDPAFTQSRRPPPGIPPALEFQAHSAPLGLCFYTGKQFPTEYHGDVFVAFHGSWNRSVPTGYKIVRVRVRENKPVSYQDFLTGFLTSRSVTGRPAGVIIGPDGSLYISDDRRGRIYRVRWDGT